MELEAAIDVVWGVTGIARIIRRSPRQVANMLAQGALPAKKVTGRWCSSRRALVEFFTLDDAKEAA